MKAPFRTLAGEARAIEKQVRKWRTKCRNRQNASRYALLMAGAYSKLAEMRTIPNDPSSTYDNQRRKNQ